MAGKLFIGIHQRLYELPPPPKKLLPFVATKLFEGGEAGTQRWCSLHDLPCLSPSGERCWNGAPISRDYYRAAKPGPPLCLQSVAA
jgi:hypothetical protein